MEALAVWRDISLLWLIFLTLIAVLPFGVIFFFCIKGLHRLRQLAKKYLPIAQDKARLVAGGTEKISQKIAQPIINIYAAGTQVSTITRTMTRRKRR